MQTTIKKSTEVKRKGEKLLKEENTKFQDDKLKKLTNNISTPKNYLPKTSTVDIYGQSKKTAVQSGKAPKKIPNGVNVTSNVSPMKDILKSATSSSSFISSKSEKNKMAVQKKVDEIINRNSSTKVKDFNVTVNSPVTRKKTYTDKKRNVVKESRREKDYSPNVKRKLNLERTDIDSPAVRKRQERERSYIKDKEWTDNDFPVVKRRQEREKSYIKEKDSPVVTRRQERERSYIKDKEWTDKDSPVVKRRQVRDNRDSKDKIDKTALENHRSNKDINERQRTKTRTLNENEVKILTQDSVDNNTEMSNLTKKLSAKPKAFYIDLDTDKAVNIEKNPHPKTASDEEVSYEDDFESYESDFDSYHSPSASEHNESDDRTDNKEVENTATVEMKEVKDEEKMLDSGSFDLRDQRSANKTKPALDFILESVENDKRTSLTDEGFQEMSSSSAVSSIKTVHVDVLDRPMFIDFTKSKNNKRKKIINDRLKQRAKDLLSIITLHEMSYKLFEMKPISYNLYMSTFGRSNYQQMATQTFEDGITEEIQTEDIETLNKWTQHPVEFTKNNICFKQNTDKRKYSENLQNYLTKFTFLTKQNVNCQNNDDCKEDYETDPLRIYFEQKDGVGPSEMLPYENYKSKLRNNECNIGRLGRFLKKMENRISRVLNNNGGNSELTELKISKFPFSKGFVPISTKNICDENMAFLNHTKISRMYFSDTKSNLIMTVHRTHDNVGRKCMICLWDIGVARREPLKILTAIDNVSIGRFTGATDGFFVAALEDSSIHLWDLSEEATWRADVAREEKSKELVEINEGNLTAFERDREWNKKNIHVGLEEDKIHCPLQACAFTNSACNMNSGDILDRLVGLEMTGDRNVSREARRVLGQIAALQRIGVLIIWSIIQEKVKSSSTDIGKAFNSKIILEKSQTINLIDHIISKTHFQNVEFNLNTAKRRIQNKKTERNIFKTNVSRPKSAFDSDSDRPISATSVKNKEVLPVQKDEENNFESGILCYDLKVMFFKNSDNYLIAKNWGEVVCCKKSLGVVRVTRLRVTADVSSVSDIEVSTQMLPYYLAATDTGIIAMCSLVENRVLLTLDCRNIRTQEVSKCHSDHKGRYITTVSTKEFGSDESRFGKLPISSISWSRVNPCCIFASLDGTIVSWELSHSDIYAKSAFTDSSVVCASGDNTLALLTPDGDVHVHKLSNEHKSKEFLLLFEKYVSLL